MNKLLRFVPFIILAIILAACNEKVADNLTENQAPHTFLSLMPDSGISKQPSKLKVSWWGDDPDGLVVGYYLTWDGIHWAFTTGNDSLFALKIGASDINYTFKVAAVDNGGNGVYDNSVVQNGINFGPEPFIDQNGDGKFNPGEKFFDIGLVDPHPASLNYPIKNSAPTVAFDKLSSLPDTSYPVMTLGWDAEDIDGSETIVKINIALNDTTKFVTLPGNTRLVMLRMKDFNSPDAATEILLNASEGNIFPEKLSGMNLNGNNKVYVQVEDISGAKSTFSSPEAQSRSWYVKKPVGNFLVINDNQSDPYAAGFFRTAFNQMHGGVLQNKYEIWNINKNKVPYDNVTFFETLKFFKYIFWYSDNNPNLYLASISSRKFIDLGGKIAFSMSMPQAVDNDLIKSFLPIDSVGASAKKDFIPTLFANENITSSAGYPALKNVSSLYGIRSIYPGNAAAEPVYSLTTPQLSGNKTIGIMDSGKKLFLIALPLAKLDGNKGNVQLLLEKIFFEDFGLTL
ncbi:MAG TPA: hypothetical protein VHO03_13585 [Ignavibacteriales bacterium]|nr:hypothetical protein [Ignavibacteriales bacterium]